ncbi:hypothetical protein ACFU44_13845 [Nocardia rhizosphaerihabitans]|uniref:hypothetical protein n=1 Tax=Nocardia rhizosphaerihabitans TaxID=1691570 RepID=UPI003670E615
MTIMNSPQLREHLKTVRYTGAGEVKNGWLNEAMQLIDQYAYEYAEKQHALIYKKYKGLDAALFAVKPHLDKPYPDDPRWTPWSRFVEPREIMLRRAFKGEDIGELEAMGELSSHGEKGGIWPKN